MEQTVTVWKPEHHTYVTRESERERERALSASTSEKPKKAHCRRKKKTKKSTPLNAIPTQSKSSDSVRSTHQRQRELLYTLSVCWYCCCLSDK